MWECKYAREAVDYRLTFLRLLKKIWLLPLSALLGCILVGGVYYMSKLCFGNGRTYQTETMFYIDYSSNVSEDENYYFNKQTWDDVITTDFFTERLIQGTNGEFGKEELIEATYAGVETDVRYLYTRCTTKDPAKSELIDAALEKAVLEFGEDHKEINSIRVEKKNTTDVSNIRLFTAALVGAVTGLIACVVIWLVLEVSDTSVYLPSTLERRYKIISLGAPSMPEFETNCKLLLEGKSNIKVVAACEKTDISGLDLKTAYTACGNPVEYAEAASLLKDADNVIVAVKAGAHNGKRLERTLEELERLGAKVTYFVLTGEDKRLIERYYRR